MNIFVEARKNMILSQLEPNNISNKKLLSAMGNIPREKFLSEKSNAQAYLDSNIEIEDGRYLVSPMIFAKMIQFANIKPNEVVLDIGCCTGYSTAIIAHLAATVVGLESNKRFIEKATELLGHLEIDNAAVVQGDLEKGYPEQGPYDVIILNGSTVNLPENILDQISDGGRVIYIEGLAPLGKAVYFEKRGKVFGKKILFDAVAPIIPGFEQNPKFQFN